MIQNMDYTKHLQPEVLSYVPMCLCGYFLLNPLLNYPMRFILPA